MGEESPDGTGDERTRRRKSRVRVRYRLEKPERGSKRLRQFYNRHGGWLVPVVMLILGIVVIWFGFKFYIGE